MLKRILQLFIPQRWRFAWIMCFAVCAATFSSTPPLLMKWMIDDAFPSGDRMIWIFAVIGLVVFPLVGGLFGIWQNHWNNQVALGVMSRIRAMMFDRLMKQSVLFFTHARSGEVVSRMTSDVEAVQDVLNKLVMNAMMQSLILLISAAVLIWMDPVLALVALGVLPLLIWPMKKTGKLRKGLKQTGQKEKAELSALLGEWFGVSGAYTSRAYGLETMQSNQFAALNESIEQNELKLQWIGRWFFMTMGIMGPLGAALIYAYGGWGVLAGRVSMGELVAFAAYMARLYAPVSQLMNLHVEWATAKGVFQRIFHYMDLEDGLPERLEPVRLQQIHGEIIVDQLSFRYQEQPLLDQISMRIPSAASVAIVGGSGAGKSTLLGLLARLMDPTQGSIQLDGVDLRDLPLRTIREHIAVVSQDSFLFYGTLADNLRMAAPQVHDDQLWDVLEAVALDELVRSLPNQLDTMVGERGYRMSGGERQRISLARALLRQPAVLLLDEATSHLDTRTEAHVLMRMKERRAGMTTIWVAHRLSTIYTADQILVMQDGQCVESGTHDQLMQAAGVYAGLVQSQVIQDDDDDLTFESQIAKVRTSS